MTVEQTGNVTPGHIATWAANGVVQDGGSLANALSKVLASVRGADFNTTSDLPILLPAAITAFALTGIIVTNASLSLTTAVGGFYPVIAKGGTPVVAASQVYSALTVSTKLLNPTVASYGSTTRFDRNILSSAWALYFALTTPQGVAATADIYLLGVDLT